jgi:hypothetical protein
MSWWGSRILTIAALKSHRRHVTTALGPIGFLDVGQGRPAVFIHGILTNSLLWRHVIAGVVSDDRRCVALDLPGHGHTPAAAEPADVSLTGPARRAIELCDQWVWIVLTWWPTTPAPSPRSSPRSWTIGSPTLTLTNCDTEGNTPPRIVKPVVMAARPWLLARPGPRIATRRRLVRALLSTGYQHVGRVRDEAIDAYAQPTVGTPESARAFARLLRAIRSVRDRGRTVTQAGSTAGDRCRQGYCD